MVDLQSMPPRELIKEFETTMESMRNTNNLASLADLARHASDVWEEMRARPIQFR